MAGFLRIGIIGCGAVTERAHLPVCVKAEGIKITALVDPNLTRAEQLVTKFGVGTALGDTVDLHGRIDAAILAVPHALHAKLGIDLLQQGIHLLVEKPMALNVVECDAMLEAAKKGRVVLAVGLMRRFAPWAHYVQNILESNVLGPVQSFRMREGFKYNWPVASDFFFKKETAGGGVLIDTGAHTLDTIVWWFGEPDQVEYYDDCEDGVEADCEIRLVMGSGVIGLVELSRTRNLGYHIVINGERGRLEVEPYAQSIKLTVGQYCLKGSVANPADSADDGSYLSMMAASFRNWIDAIRTDHPPTVNGFEGRRSIALIEQCYRQRQPLIYPWFGDESLTSPLAIPGRTL